MKNNLYIHLKLIPSEATTYWTFTHKDNDTKDNGETWKEWKTQILKELRERELCKKEDIRHSAELEYKYKRVR